MAKNLTEGLVCLKIPYCNVAIITSKSEYFKANLFNNEDWVLTFSTAVK